MLVCMSIKMSIFNMINLNTLENFKGKINLESVFKLSQNTF